MILESAINVYTNQYCLHVFRDKFILIFLCIHAMIILRLSTY